MTYNVERFYKGHQFQYEDQSHSISIAADAPADLATDVSIAKPGDIVTVTVGDAHTSWYFDENSYILVTKNTDNQETMQNDWRM